MNIVIRPPPPLPEILDPPLFYGFISTPSRIVARPKGRTIQLTPPVPVPVVSFSGADDDASNQQLQPSVIELLKVMEAQQKEIEKL